MNHERELKLLARQLVWVTDELKNEHLRDWEKDELKEEYNEIINKLLQFGCDSLELTQYMDEYKCLLFGELEKWLNGELDLNKRMGI